MQRCASLLKIEDGTPVRHCSNKELNSLKNHVLPQLKSNQFNTLCSFAELPPNNFFNLSMFEVQFGGCKQNAYHRLLAIPDVEALRDDMDI